MNGDTAYVDFKDSSVIFQKRQGPIKIEIIEVPVEFTPYEPKADGFIDLPFLQKEQFTKYK